MGWTTGIATSKIFHPDLGLFHDGIAEGYYKLGLDGVVLFIAWGIVLYGAFSGLYRMAAGSPRGVKQVMMAAVAGLLLGLTPKIRGTSVGDVGFLWGFYHGIYSQLYGNGALAKLATAGSFKEINKQQINAFKTLVRFKAEIAVLRVAVGLLGGIGSNSDNAETVDKNGNAATIGKIGNTGTIVKIGETAMEVGAKFNPLLAALKSALDEIRHQIDKIANELDRAVDKAIQDTVWAAVHLIEVNTFLIYITAAMVIFVSLFWPLVAAWLVFPSTMKATITGVGMVVGATLGMVLAGPMMLTGLAVVFSTTSTALNQYQATIAESTQEINKLSEQLAKTLDTATHNAVQGTEIINQGLGTLEAAKQKIVQNAQMGFPAETPMAVQVCKLLIQRNNTTDTFPGIFETADCIGGNTLPTESAPKVTQGQVEEYISNYKVTEAELAQKLASLANQADGLNLGLLDRIANSILGIITRFQIQLQIAFILSWIIGVVTLLFVGLVVALGVNLSGNFVLNRLR